MLIVPLLCCLSGNLLTPLVDNNQLEEDASGLAEIVDELNVPTIIVLLLQKKFKGIYGQFLRTTRQQTMIFDDREKFLNWVGESQSLSFSTTTLIFGRPNDLVEEIVDRKLDHRLNLFLFYWNSTGFSDSLVTIEPLKVVFLTVPRTNVIRVYYNQASPDGQGNLTLVNWYDGNGMGLLKKPLLPSPREVYKDFRGRNLRIPVIHSPPWLFVNYHNDSDSLQDDDYQQNITFSPSYSYNESEYQSDFVSVTGGRDDNLIKLLARKLNFRYEYIDLPERVQGSATGSQDNTTFTGGLGMLQRREAHLFLGDIAISLERSTAVEFSFFTLADSGTFVTHIPQRLNEALALIRPFHYSVWPPLLLTILLSGPILYLLVYLPHRYCPRRSSSEVITFPLEYISEMRYGLRENHLCRPQRGPFDEEELPPNFFSKCIWFSYNLFLKQNCRFPYNQGVRVKIMVAMFWICATYILSDVYSAQLTSQLARPAREAAIDTLHKLEHAMRVDNYELYVEKQSASLSILENGTENEIFHRLYKLMVLNGMSEGNASYLIDSVEQGIEMVRHAGSRKVVLGGRETLFFNMRRYGVKHFQMSEKLYTRYSAVAVFAGCPFLESLNNVLIRLFESGVLDRMTSEEYDKMYQKFKKHEDTETPQTTKDVQTTVTTEEVALKKLNLRTLKGAFIVLLMGFGLSFVTFLLETLEMDPRVCLRRMRAAIWWFKAVTKKSCVFLWRNVLQKLIALVMFKYKWN